MIRRPESSLTIGTVQLLGFFVWRFCGRLRLPFSYDFHEEIKSTAAPACVLVKDWANVYENNRLEADEVNTFAMKTCKEQHEDEQFDINLNGISHIDNCLHNIRFQVSIPFHLNITLLILEFRKS